MNNILKLISFTGLALTLIPGALVLIGVIDNSLQYTLMLIGMVAWFSSAPFWMHSTSLDDN
ncbi:MAG: hypothetical protein AB3N64_14385 [Puniceicoccaceae bacterium]